MAKCLKCGKSTIVRGHVKLADGAVCTPCFKSLGFKLTDTAGACTLSYDEIKDGKDMLYTNMRRRVEKHQEWLEAHPDVAAFMDALDEDQDEPEPIEEEETEE